MKKSGGRKRSKQVVRVPTLKSVIGDAKLRSSRQVDAVANEIRKRTEKFAKSVM